MRYLRPILFLFFSVLSLHAQDMAFWQLEMTGEKLGKTEEGSEAVPVFQAFSNRKGGNSPDGFRLYEPEIFASFNSTHPSGANDGAVWQGRGANGRLSAGFEYGSGLLYVSFVPEIWGAQNAGFAVVPGTEETKDYWFGLDRPQRFGDGPHRDWSWGQTNLRLVWKGFTAGFSTENIWLGPGVRNAAILSTNADGFPHFDIGTQVPLATGIGSFEFRFLWGRLHESEYFDDDSSNDFKLYTGGTIAYSPSFVPGLTLGFNRYFLSPWNTMNGFKFFQFFSDGLFKQLRRSFDTESGDDDVDQVLSLTFDWVFKEAGLDLYLEWARNDHSMDIQDFLMQPDHSEAYVAGLTKSFGLNGGKLILNLEMADFGNTRGTNIRPTGPWYRHYVLPGGYTNDGQVLGAGIGTGSNSQYVGLRYLSSWGEAGLGFERIAFDTDYFYSFAVADSYYYRHYNLQCNMETFVKLTSMTLFDIYFKTTLAYTFNHNWTGDNEYNLAFLVGLRWKTDQR